MESSNKEFDKLIKQKQIMEKLKIEFEKLELEKGI
jgi:hypothetical protein